MAIPFIAKINTVLLPKISGFAVSRNKLYSEAGRNMNGDLRTTFIGIFPKITIDFTYTTETEMSTIATLLDEPSFTLEYWDVKSKTIKSGTYYAGDFETPVFLVEKDLYKPFKVTLVPFNKVT